MTGHASVTLKIATSLDARIALSNGVSQWITGKESRTCAHQMRADHDAVLVGVGTVLADDPLLTARTVPLPATQPVRIIADSRLRTPPASRIAKSASVGRVILAHAGIEGVKPGHYGASLDLWNVGDGAGRVSPTELLRRARAEALDRIFLEGGSQLAASFLSLGLVDRIEWFRAPIILGGDGIPAIAGLGLDRIKFASRWRMEDRRNLGSDILETWLAA